MALEAVIGIQSEDSALKRWCHSSHDALLERPWIVIGSSNGQIEIDHRSVDLPEDGIKTITTAEEASALIEEATDHLLKEGATYLLWNKAGNPPANWITMMRGIKQSKAKLLHQIGETRHGLEEINPIRFNKDRSLLAIDASWLARRNPQQVLSFIQHWMGATQPRWANYAHMELKSQIEPLLQPKICEGILILAASKEQVKEVGRGELRERATRRALEGGFTKGFVLELESSSRPDNQRTIKRV